MITVFTLVSVWDLESKVKKLLRSQNLEGPEGKEAEANNDLALNSLLGKKVRIFLDDDCENQDCTYFMISGWNSFSTLPDMRKCLLRQKQKQ